jgi:glycosyltransferase involved in cell wall biosynthesis
MVSISIAMTVFNGERYLDQQLESLNRQTLVADEIVITDDQSSDRSPEIIAAFQSRSKCPVRYFRNETTLGWRANFLKACSLCNSDLIALCDQDDIWLPEKLQICSRYFVNSPDVLAVHHNLRLIDHNQKPYGAQWWNDGDFPTLTKPLSRNILWHHPSGLAMIFRRSLCQFDKFWPLSAGKFFMGEKAAHDQWYFSLATLLGVTAYDPTILVNYRQHQTNAVGVRDKAPSQASGDKDTYVRELENNLVVVKAMAEILRLASAELTDFSERATSASLMLDRQARLLSDQITTIRDPSLVSRIGRIASSGLRGAYFTSNFGLGKTAAIKALTHREISYGSLTGGNMPEQ